MKLFFLNYLSHNLLTLILIAYSLSHFIECKRGGGRGRDEGGYKQVVSTGSCKTGSCQVPYSCFSILVDKDYIESCELSDGSRGVCCPNDVTENNVDSKKRRIIPAKTDEITVTSEELGSAWDAGKQYVADVEKLETKLKKKRLIILPGSTESVHQNFFGRNPLAAKLGRDGTISLQATLSIAKLKKITASQARYGFQNIDLSQNSNLQNLCPKEPTCNFNSKYRTVDGSCNNERNKAWGKAMSAFNRMLHPAYADGVDSPRVASDGSALPSARLVSSMLAPDSNEQNRRYTLLVMQFGQFLDHDLDRTAGTRSANNSDIQCCGTEIKRDATLKHPACFPIEIPKDDRFFSQHKQTCMNFVRSAAAPKDQCKLGHREQLNQISSYIDGGPIYGSSAEDAANLRSFKGGKLKTSQVNNRDFLPFANESTCSLPNDSQMKCFAAGDGRINEQVDLPVMHALWLREHNRIAEQLSRLNPNWNDETLYQESRRIVGAELQHIAYNEFLPVLIGPRSMQFADLQLRQNGFNRGYSSDINAAITSVFATAAYRFHTLIPGVYDLQNADSRVFDTFDLSKNFDNPQILYKSGTFDGLINGLTGQSVQQGDHYFSTAITQHLFQSASKPFGMDLISLNIQRGRDHGLPGYNAWRQECGFRPFRNFKDLEWVMKPNVAHNISKLYRNVDDIDLFIGGFSETIVWGTLVGPTFACLLGEQFRRIKNGDRFWYENPGRDTSFSYNQLLEIKHTSLARIICDNGDNIQSMQVSALMQPAYWNPKISCNQDEGYAAIPRVNLNFWQNERIWS